MKLQLPKLPFAMDALEPFLSEQALEYHYRNHHQAYVDKVNALIVGTKYEAMDLEKMIRTAKGHLYESAAQAWNHAFFWNCLTPVADLEELSQPLLRTIRQDFGSLEQLKIYFYQAAMDLFGSGWTWLVRDSEGNLKVINTHNAYTPIKEGYVPLLVCDVWEHAYYVDYKMERNRYLDSFWNVVNWKFVSDCFSETNFVQLSKTMEQRARPQVISSTLH